MLDFLRHKPSPVKFTPEAEQLLRKISERATDEMDRTPVDPLRIEQASPVTIRNSIRARRLQTQAEKGDLRNRQIAGKFHVGSERSGTSMEDLGRLQARARDVYTYVTGQIKDNKVKPTEAMYTLTTPSSSTESFTVIWDWSVNEVKIDYREGPAASPTRTTSAQIKLAMFGDDRYHFSVSDTQPGVIGRPPKRDHSSRSWGGIHDDTADVLNFLYAKVTDYVPNLAANAPKEKPIKK